LSEKEQAALKEHGLFNLKDFLPKKPTEVELKVIKEMFEASVDGEAFDMERWGQYYKPSGASANTGDPVATTRTSAPAAPAVVDEPDMDDEVKAAPKAAAKPAPKATDESKSPDSRASDILAMIRNRNKQ
jgi:hypothetical protein